MLEEKDTMQEKETAELAACELNENDMVYVSGGETYKKKEKND